MDFEKRVSVMEGRDHKLLSNRSILSRNSSAGCSSRMFYCRNAEGIPFKWEMQPGTPINPPQEDVIPPISPPPAVLSLGLPKPRMDAYEEPQGFSMRSKLMSLKRILVTNKKINKLQGVSNSKKKEARDDIGSGYFADCDDPFRSSLSDGDHEFLSSSPCNSSSSSSFSSSSSNFHPVDDDHHDHAAAHGCSPLKFSSIRSRFTGRKV